MLEVSRAERLLEQLRADYPDIRFKVGKKFKIRPGTRGKTVFYEPSDSSRLADLEKRWSMRLLHEVGHAILGHKYYICDVDRLAMERDAWAEARKLAKRYNIEFDDELAEMDLNTYRDWLYQRSICANCGSTCYQMVDGRYVCPHCMGL